MSRVVTLKVSDVVVGERHRTDLGDIAELAKSISEVGLLQPIVVDEQHRLIAGHRRFVAWKQLHAGTEPIPAYVVGTVDSAALRLKAERDENTCRKDFNPVEAVALGRALEKLEKPKAKERQLAGTRPSGKLPEGSGGQTRDKVGGAVGMSGRSYDKAKTVVVAAEQNPDDPDAQAALAELKDSGMVERAYRRLKYAKGTQRTPLELLTDATTDPGQAKPIQAVAKRLLADVQAGRLEAKSALGTFYTTRREWDGHSTPRVASANSKRSKERAHNKQFAGIVGHVQAIADVLPALNPDEIDWEQFPDWRKAFDEAMRALRAFKKGNDDGDN